GEEGLRCDWVEVDMPERVIAEPVTGGNPVLQDKAELGRVGDRPSVHEADGAAHAVAPQDLDDLIGDGQARGPRWHRPVCGEIVDRNGDFRSGDGGPAD